MRSKLLEVETPHGTARAHLHRVSDATAALVLGHGAGGGVESRDLVTARDAALAEGLTVALVEQPYRVAGRRSPAPAKQLDAAWNSVIEALRESHLRGVPLIVGGRSLGARVACRTAEETEAIGVLCLAFPLVPPRRTKPAPSRLPELDAVRVPTLVVQGESDPFGMPPPGPRRRVVRVRGDHSLRSDLDAVAVAVRSWLAEVAEVGGYNGPPRRDSRVAKGGGL
jgi:predicted alpha/beta-hydrolase family hydrolase